MKVIKTIITCCKRCEYSYCYKDKVFCEKRQINEDSLDDMEIEDNNIIPDWCPLEDAE